MCAVVLLLLLSMLDGMGADSVECNILKYSVLTVDQQNMMQSITYSMVFDASGEDIKPVITLLQDGTAEVCFPGTVLIISDVVNDTTYIAEYNLWKGQNDTATADQQAKEQEASDELKDNTLCYGDLDEVLAEVEAEADLKAAVVKLARCISALTVGKS